MLTLVGAILILAIVVLLIRGKVSSLPPIFIVLPILAALICGFSFADINKFISSGLSSVLNTALLFAFSMVYFNILTDAGMFDIVVKKVMRFMGNKVEVALLVAAVITAVCMFSGSGAITVLIVIPTMLPIFKKMKIRPVALLLMVSLASGIMNMFPWCPSVLRIASATKLDPYSVWQTALPVQIIGLILTFILAIVIGKIERRHGAGMSNEEFAQMKLEFAQPAKLKISKSLMIFDAVFTVVMLLGMLFGWYSTNIGFMVGLAILLLTNFRNPKEQTAQIKKFAGDALNMVLIMFSIGVLVGVLDGTGMIKGITNTLVSAVPTALGAHITFIVALISVPLSMVVGSDASYLILVPLLGKVVAPFGGTMLGMSIAMMIGACAAANLCLVGPVPYLSLGLAGVEMKDNLKGNFLWVWGMGIVLAIIAAIVGVFIF